MGKKNKYLVDKSKPFIEKVIKRAMNDFRSCAIKTNKELHKEITQMYDTLIEQFYEYKTTSYVRYLEHRKGTGEGTNLLYGKNFSMNNRASHSPKLIVEFSGEEIEDYNRHRWDTPDQILDCVLHGIRFPYETRFNEEGERIASSGPMWIDPKSLFYHGKYWSFNGGTIQDAFDKFGQEWDRISSEAFYSRWDEYVKQWS